MYLYIFIDTYYVLNIDVYCIIMISTLSIIKIKKNNILSNIYLYSVVHSLFLSNKTKTQKLALNI